MKEDYVEANTKMMKMKKFHIHNMYVLPGM